MSDKEKLSIWLPKPLCRKLRVRAAESGQRMNQVVEKALKDYLARETTDAEDGRRALDLLRNEEPFELALVDWNMRLMSGYDFVCEVRGATEFDSVRLVMVTTETEVERMADALEAGADEYIMKPFNKDMLVEKLQLLGIEPEISE